jgi:hypothetical protein
MKIKKANDDKLSIEYSLYIIYTYYLEPMRRPGFEPGLPDWQSDVLDQTGRPSL